MSNTERTGKTLLNQLSELSGTVDAPCSIGKIAKKVDEETRLALITVLQSPASSAAIHRALHAEGFSISRHTIDVKRKCFKEETHKECACFPNNLGVQK